MKYLSLRTILSIVIVLSFSFTLTAQENQHLKTKAHWSYKGENGPGNWGKLAPEFAPCGNGKSQSPIDLVKAIKAKLNKIDLHYSESDINLINNGHTIQENYDEGSYAEIDGEKFQLLQLHFHTPSEHTVNGKHYAMEMHLVHKDDKNNLAVIGVFFKIGKKNTELEKLVSHLPSRKTEKYTSDKIKIDLNKLLPSDKSYYHYYGSLTTPNCAEGVNWKVFVNPIEASKEQINEFHKIMGSNARPTQPLNKRFLLISE